MFRARSTGAAGMHPGQFGLKDRYDATLLGCCAYGKLQSVMAVSAGRKSETFEALAELLPDNLSRS
jgi:hypothetical protein